MSDLFIWVLIIVWTPFLIYTIFRIVSSAVFKSFFEQKTEFEKKGGKYNAFSEGSKKTDKGTDATKT